MNTLVKIRQVRKLLNELMDSWEIGNGNPVDVANHFYLVGKITSLVETIEEELEERAMIDEY